MLMLLVFGGISEERPHQEKPRYNQQERQPP